MGSKKDAGPCKIRPVVLACIHCYSILHHNTKTDSHIEGDGILMLERLKWLQEKLIWRFLGVVALQK